MAPVSAMDVIHIQGVPLIDKLEIATAMADLAALHRDIIEMRSVGYKRSEIARP